MASLFHKRGTCRLCSSSNVRMAIPLNAIPLTSPNIQVTDEIRSRGNVDVMVPVDLWICDDCGLIQLLDVIDSAVQYNNFLYKTSISLGLADHFRTLAAEVVGRSVLKTGDLVVEVGSNDGTLLRFFKDQNFTVLGIDPARETARDATERGIETIADFFTAKRATAIGAERGKAKVIVSNNTFANIDQCEDFGRGIADLLDKDGIFVFETSYGADVIEHGLLDTVYHEHLSYFTVEPLVRYFDRLQLELFDVQRIPTKGGSIRGFVRHKNGMAVSPNVARLVEHEHALGLRGTKIFEQFSARMVNARETLEAQIDAVIKAGGFIAAYGASVGSVTLINQFDLCHRLSFIADDKPLGAALVGPGYSIPIVSPQALYDQKPGIVIILAWRYAGTIIDHHQKYTQEGGTFAVPLPI